MRNILAGLVLMFGLPGLAMVVIAIGSIWLNPNVGTSVWFVRGVGLMLLATGFLFAGAQRIWTAAAFVVAGWFFIQIANVF